jgi:hypothetical protein
VQTLIAATFGVLVGWTCSLCYFLPADGRHYRALEGELTTEKVRRVHLEYDLERARAEAGARQRAQLVENDRLRRELIKKGDLLGALPGVPVIDPAPGDMIPPQSLPANPDGGR